LWGYIRSSVFICKYIICFETRCASALFHTAKSHKHTYTRYSILHAFKRNVSVYLCGCLFYCSSDLNYCELILMSNDWHSVNQVSNETKLEANYSPIHPHIHQSKLTWWITDLSLTVCLSYFQRSIHPSSLHSIHLKTSTCNQSNLRST